MAVAFKEWAIICEALGQGIQSIILRKRGIAEGPFNFKFSEFFLFPTQYHQQLEKTIAQDEFSATVNTRNENEVAIQYIAKIEWTKLVENWEQIRMLKPYHIWRESVLQDRFYYGGMENSLHLAFVRVFVLHPVWRLKKTPEFVGCRSWVCLPEAPKVIAIEPVITDSANTTISAEIHQIISQSSSAG